MTLIADLYFSFRSPYSYLAVGRYRALAEDNAVDIAPRGHLWASKKQSWIILDPNLPAFAKQPDDVQAWRTTLV